MKNKFNEQSSSDFTVKCKDTEFYVHQSILEQASDYFSGLFRNEFQETRRKSLIIDDFEPAIVELMLRYLYNGAISWMEFHENTVELMSIADKYNLTQLFDTCDSYLAQKFAFEFSTCSKLTYESLQHRIGFIDKLRATKFAAAIFHWKIHDAKGDDDVTDDQWCTLLRQYPDFAILSAQAFGRKEGPTGQRYLVTLLLAHPVLEN